MTLARLWDLLNDAEAIPDSVWMTYRSIPRAHRGTAGAGVLSRTVLAAQGGRFVPRVLTGINGGLPMRAEITRGPVSDDKVFDGVKSDGPTPNVLFAV